MAEFTESPLEEEDEKQNLGGILVETISIQEPLPWKLYVDGASNQRGSGVRLVVMSPERITTEKSLRLCFSTSNNEVEYEVLLERMAMVQKNGGKDSGSVLKLEISRGPSKGRVGSQGFENARVSDPG